MTFLELVKRTRQECGIAGDGPITVANQTREMKRLVDWVAQAWVDIQNSRSDWDFLRKSVTFSTVAGQQDYAPATLGLSDFKKWRNGSVRQYLESAGIATEILLDQWSYNDFRDYFLLGSRRLVQARPQAYAITPDRKLSFGFTPNDVYITTAEYWQKAQRLESDSDEPVIPEDYHMLIVYEAMKKYGMFEVANEQITVAREEYTRLYNALLNEYTPPIEYGGSLI